MQAEREYSAFNFEAADTERLFRHFADAESECQALLERAPPLVLPAYDQCLKASHLFNLLDARGVISATEQGGLHRAGAGAGAGMLHGLAEVARAPRRRGGLAAMPELLLELLSEEIPARMQERAAADLGELVVAR